MPPGGKEASRQGASIKRKIKDQGCRQGGRSKCRRRGSRSEREPPEGKEARRQGARMKCKIEDRGQTLARRPEGQEASQGRAVRRKDQVSRGGKEASGQGEDQVPPGGKEETKGEVSEGESARSTTVLN